MNTIEAPTAAQSVTIIEAMDDPELFGPLFTDASWLAWRAFLTALFGLPLSE